jgi:hypothetical protein
LTTLAARTYIALLHFPVYDRNGKTVATAITNLDIHDLARGARTFGLAAYYLVTPLERQRELAKRIVSHWEGEEGPRAEALRTVRVAASLEQTIAEIEKEKGAPRVIATSARRNEGCKSIGFRTLRKEAERQERPLLLLLGTGWGLENKVIEGCDRVLSPIRGPGAYNHLSVRQAAGIILDRLFGREGEEESES